MICTSEEMKNRNDKQTAWIKESQVGLEGSVSIATFKHNNIGFDIYFNCPVVKIGTSDGSRLLLYLAIKSRDDYDGILMIKKSVGQNSFQRLKLDTAANVEEIDNQFELFLSFMSNTDYFQENRFECVWVLCATVGSFLTSVMIE